MGDTVNKSFAYQFLPLQQVSLSNDIYGNIGKIQESEQQFWCHFDKPSKNLQTQIAKKFNIPKAARIALFAEEVRSRCLKVENGYVFILHGIEPQNLSEDEDYPTLRFWITERGILSFSSRKINAIQEVQKSIKTQLDITYIQCFLDIIEHNLWSLEDSIYKVDERLNEIESHFEYTDEAAHSIRSIRQDIIYLRRYILPQRDAVIALANKLTYGTESTNAFAKELSDNMQRQVESIEMLRERAVVIQDGLTNQIAEVANRRMYILTIIMLIFTPPFFIMGIFSMYMPIPGTESHATWWIVVGVMFVVSLGLYKLFKWKRWL